MEKKWHLLLGSRGCGNAIFEAAFALARVPLDYEKEQRPPRGWPM